MRIFQYKQHRYKQVDHFFMIYVICICPQFEHHQCILSCDDEIEFCLHKKLKNSLESQFPRTVELEMVQIQNFNSPIEYKIKYCKDVSSWDKNTTSLLVTTTFLKDVAVASLHDDNTTKFLFYWIPRRWHF